jgi:hypothetical protein
MSHLSIVPSKPETVDIHHHHLAAEGFHLRYCLVGYPAAEGELPRPVGEIELLADQEHGAAFMEEAERLGRRFALSRPVCTVYPDHDGGPWSQIVAEGPRALIGELMLLAQRMGFERRPWA